MTVTHAGQGTCALLHMQLGRQEFLILATAPGSGASSAPTDSSSSKLTARPALGSAALRQLWTLRLRRFDQTSHQPSRRPFENQEVTPTTFQGHERIRGHSSSRRCGLGKMMSDWTAFKVLTWSAMSSVGGANYLGRRVVADRPCCLTLSTSGRLT
jgi:hypothetical protein